MRRLLLALVLGMLLAACGGPTGDPGADPDPSDEPADADPDDGADDGGADDGSDDGDDGDAEDLQREVQLATEDAAGRLGVDPGDLEVVVAERVTWSDGSLGCPEPGEAYTQALVDGYRVVLEADGEEVAYHGAEGEPPFHCEDPQPPAG